MSNLNVLLVDPFYNPKTVPPNWSLGLIEKKLNKANINTAVIDFVDTTCEGKNLAHFKKQETVFFQNVRNQVHKYDYVYITSSLGIPLKQKPVFPRIVKTCEEIKKNNPTVKIIVGGSTVNYANKMLGMTSFEDVDYGLIDKYIFGDEIKFVEYLFKIKNIPTDHLFDSEVIEWNAWDFEKYPDYLSLLTAKGCVYNCPFCFESKIFDRKYETISIDSVLENIKVSLLKRNIKKFAIEDSSFLSNPNFEKFCDEVIKNKWQIQWSAYGRIDQILKYQKLLPKIKEAGCTSFIIGIESPKNNILKEINKNCTSFDAVETIELLKKNSIGVQGCFVLGFPGDTYKDIEKTINYGLDLDLFAYRWHVYQPNITDRSQKYITNDLPKTIDYLKIQTNIPDSCIPETLEFSGLPLMLLIEEHFLIRAIPYLNPGQQILQKFGYNDLVFSKTFNIFKKMLLHKSATFDEEKMYSLI